MQYQIGGTYTIIIAIDSVENGVTTAEKHTDYEKVIVYAVDSKTKRLVKKYSRDEKDGYDTLVEIDDYNLQLTIKSDVSRNISEGANLLLYPYFDDEDAPIEGNYMGDPIMVGPWTYNPTVSEVV